MKTQCGLQISLPVSRLAAPRAGRVSMIHRPANRSQPRSPKSESEALAKQFEGLEVSFTRKSGENDQLFGSVTSGDIADALEKKSFHIDKRKIQIHEPLKTIGEFTIPVKLHKDVTAHLKVLIGKEAGE